MSDRQGPGELFESATEVPLRTVRGDPGALLAGAPEHSLHIRVMTPASPALVLGSTQKEVVADRAALGRDGIPVVRRRTGGGVVFVEPDDGSLWLELVVPAGRGLVPWDVRSSMTWFGELWRRALAAVGVQACVSRDNVVPFYGAEVACFATVTVGEVVVGDAKLVGIAQRRSRDLHHFASLVWGDGDPAKVVEYLDLDRDLCRALRRRLRSHVVSAGVGARVLAESFAAVLSGVLAERERP